MQRPDREHTVRELFDNMNALRRVMAGHIAALSRDYPVSPSQLELLSAVHSVQPVSFKDLAQQLCLTPGAVSQLAESLEAQGYIGRHADTGDRRVQLLQVTDAGQKLLTAVEKRRKRMLADVIQDLTDDELSLWLRVQQKVLHHYTTSIRTKSSP